MNALCLLRTPSARSRLLRRLASFSGGERGQSMVEFAITLPFMLLIVTGIFLFGIAINNYLSLTDAVGIGARDISVSRNITTIDPCGAAAAAITNAAPNLTASNIKLTFTLTNQAGTTLYASPSTAANKASCSTATTDLTQYGSAEVIATYPCNLTLFGMTHSCLLTAQTTELIQ